MMFWKRARLFFVVLLLSSCDLAFAVKSVKLDIPKDQAIAIEVPPDQWATKETSWTSSSINSLPATRPPGSKGTANRLYGVVVS